MIFKIFILSSLSFINSLDYSDVFDIFFLHNTWFGFFIQWHVNLRGLFNAKPIIVKDRQGVRESEIKRNRAT